MKTVQLTVTPVRALTALAVIACLGASFMASQAAARSAASAALLAPPAPVVALVDLPKVFESLKEREAREKELIASAEAKQAELTQMGKEIEDETKKIQVMTDPDAKQAAILKLLEKQAVAQSKKQAYEVLLDQQRAEVLKRMYNKVAETAKKMAEAQGITIVMANDQSISMGNGASTAEVRQTLGMRRVLWAANSHDITGEIITQMNLDFAAGR